MYIYFCLFVCLFVCLNPNSRTKEEFQANTTKLPNLGVLKGTLATKKKKKKRRLDLLMFFSPHMLTNIMSLKKKKKSRIETTIAEKS